MLHTDLIAPIPVLLQRHAKARGSKIAYRDSSSKVTYAELATRTGNLAGHLADNGIQAGDKVAIFLPNSVAWIESCLAINRAGAISVPISYEATESEILYRLQDADCSGVITTDQQASLIARLQQQLPALGVNVFVSQGAQQGEGLRYEDLAASAPRSQPKDPIGG